MTNATLSTTARAPGVRGEAVLLAAILLLFLSLGVGMSSWYPAPWGDEVMYTDPSARYSAGKGFTSAAWPGQDAAEFWAGNCPLHEMVLIPWLRVFGATARSVRSLDVVLGVLAALVLWRSAQRSGWIGSAGGRLGLAVLLLSSSSLTFMSHYGRPDALTLLLAAGMAAAFAAAPGPGRNARVVALGALFPWAGLQLCAMAAAAAFIYLLLARRRARAFCAWLAAGIGIGLITLGGFYAAHGVARRFVENTLASGHTLSGELAQLAVKHDASAARRAAARLDGYLHFYRVWFVDASYPWVMLSIIACSVWAWRRRMFQALSPLGYGLVAGLAVPVLVLLAGKYPVYYGWMGFFIAALCAMAVISRFWGAWSQPMRWLTAAPLVVACGMGLPRQWLTGGPPVNQAKLDDFARANLVPADHVMVDGPAYYASINRAAETYYMNYAGGRGLREIPSAEREALTALLIVPANLEACVAKAGGRWKAGPVCEYASGPEGQTADLTLYRRER